jgi:NitT/TauT family transport system substrate-binding protein
MSTQHARRLSRRTFLAGLPLAGTAELLGLHPRLVAAESPPETTRLRLVRGPAICVAPEYVAEELLPGEGFTEVQYVKKESIVAKQTAFAAGEVDLTLLFSGPFLLQLEAGDPLVLLAGMHVGCFELFGTEQVRAIRDLKGRTVAVNGLGAAEHVFVASMAAYMGLGPRRNITWVAHPRPRLCGYLPRARLTPSSPCRQPHRNSGRRGSGTW